MTRGKGISDLLSLLKVFDANFIADADCEKLQGLDINNADDVATACAALLKPEFLTYPTLDQRHLVETLRRSLANPEEDFGELFERIALAFDQEVNRPGF